MKILEFLAEEVKIDPNQANIPTLTPTEVLAGVLYTTYVIAAAFAVITIILAGYTFVTASYDQTKIVKAKNAILYAVVGLIAVIAAFAITQFVIGKLT